MFRFFLYFFFGGEFIADVRFVSQGRSRGAIEPIRVCLKMGKEHCSGTPAG